MTNESRLALGLLALAPGNLCLIAALTLHFALPFASVEFTKGFFIGLSIAMNATAIVLLLSSVNAWLRPSSSTAREAK
jgi:hypothetical protein